MKTCQYCQRTLDASAGFCGFCGHVTSVTINEQTRFSDAAIHPPLNAQHQESTFITPPRPVQDRGQQISAERSRNNARYQRNTPYGNSLSQERAALSTSTPVSAIPASDAVTYMHATPSSPIDYIKKPSATPDVQPAQSHQYPQQAVRLSHTPVPVNPLAPTTPSPVAKDRSLRRSTGRTIAISALLLAIAIIAPLLYIAVTHANAMSAAAPLGLKDCPTMPSNATLKLGSVVAGRSQPVSMPFTLCTQGTGSVNWTSTWDQPQASWLQLAHSGQIIAPQTQQINVSAAPKNLKAGTYTTTVTFSAQNNTNVPLTVTLTVQNAPSPTPIVPNNQPTQPCIKIDQTTLNFTVGKDQTNPAAQSITLSNPCATGKWSSTSSSNWLTVNPTHGTLQGNDALKISIAPNSTGLAAGTYNATLTFNDGTNTVKLNVNLTVQPAAPCLSGNSTLNFSAQQNQTNSQQTTIQNRCGPGNWTATSTTKWLAFTPASGTLQGGDSITLSVVVDSSGLNAGSYNGIITVSDGKNAATVNVTLTVHSSPACIQISTSSLHFTAPQNSEAQQITLTNPAPCGPGNWSAHSDSAWLSATPNMGILKGDDTIAVKIVVDSSTLAPGIYNGTVTFSDGTNTVKVHVTLTVQAVPPPSQPTPTPQS